jgi:AcrR family transcriptional regulator
MPRPFSAHIRETTGGETEAVREHILEAAYRVISTRGLAAASTRAIAVEADVAAGTLYNYFDGRLQLVAKAMLRAMDMLIQPAAGLVGRAGQESVAANLRYFARHISRMLDEIVPLGAAAFSDRELLGAMRKEMSRGHTAVRPVKILTGYLKAEVALGRIPQDSDCEAAATIVFGICHNHAFHRYLSGSGSPQVLKREIDFIAGALTAGR